MTLQSKNLVMVGLGISGDNPPPNPAQPPLVDGIHLRWAFEASKGFPWHGFYLFRREHRPPADLKATIVALPSLPIGPTSADTLTTSQGEFTSDQILSLTDYFDPQGQLDLAWRDYLLFIPNEIVSQIEVTIGLRQAIPDTAAITVTAFLWGVPVGQVTVSGQANSVVTRSLAFDAMTAIKFSGGPAAVVEIKYLTLSAARSGPAWSAIAGFPYPLCLPLTHPDYPCTPGATEDLKVARDTARQRILYGDLEQFTPVPEVIYDLGDITVVQDSPIVQGQGTKWEQNLAGALLQVKGDSIAYMILSVLDANRLVLSREYTGSSGSGQVYAVYKDPFGQLYDNLVHLVQGGTASSPVPMVHRWLPQSVYSKGTISVQGKSATVIGSGTSWGAELKDLVIQINTYGKPVGYRILSVDSATQLTIDLPYPAPSSSGLTYQILPRLGEDAEGDMAPQLPNQSPLQLALLGALHPAVAQMLGLYWVDQSTAAGQAYDYLIVAARTAFPVRTGDKAQDALDWLGTQGLDGPEVDAFIVFNQSMKPAKPLDPPTDLEAYALPGGGFPETYAAGLRWDLGTYDQGELLPGKPIFYHVWRADSGTTEPTSAPNTYTLLTENRPVLIAKPDPPGKELPRRPDWPPSSLRLNFIDRGISEGWYSYQINGIDIFGRYSPNSAPFPWLKWNPPPDPRPWYWDRTTVIKVHDFALGLLDKTPPPPPTEVEAFALEPADPWLVKDEAYTSWWNDLTVSQWYKDLTTEQKQDLIPLRVRWLWTEAAMRQAPDTREFRIYFQSGPQNALPGRVTKVTPVSGKTDESAIETDIPNNRGANAYVGASLRIGADNFTILGSDASSPLKLRVKSGPVITAGSVTVTEGSEEINGTNTQWSASLAGLTFNITGEQTKYRILKVDLTLQKLTLDRKYHGQSSSGKAYVISGKLPEANQPCSVVIPSGDGNTSAHPLFTNFSAPTAWQERYAVVAYNSQFTNSLRPARDPTGKALRGEDATVTSNNVVKLNDVLLDLSSLDAEHPLFTLWLFLESDNSPSKTYRVLAVDDQAKTVTLDGKPRLRTSPSSWTLGHPVRRYEVFLPSASDSYHQGLPLKPSLSEPIVYGSIGVSAADDKNHTADNPKWASGRWGGRNGNEGLVSAPAIVFRVLRKTPEAPTIPTFATDKLYATHADYHSHSYYTVRWVPVTGLKTHIFRALDDALFQADWLIRSTRSSLNATNPDHSEIFPTDWDTTRRQSAASQLNAIASAASYASLSADARELLACLPGNAGVKDAAGLDKWDWEIRRSRKSLNANDKYLPPEWTPAQDTAAMQLKRQTAVAQLNAITSLAAYGGLSDDAKRVLANLPGNERAFSQITIEPLDPADPANANRLGPDNPIGYVVDPALRAYQDFLDGRSQNAYFYRAAHVDGAHNRGLLSQSTPPVYCPDVTPPKRPILLEAGGGPKTITLRWLENMEEDLDYYLLYRTDSEEAARELRKMVLHKQIAVSPTATPRTGEVSPSQVTDANGNPVARRLQLDDLVSANEVFYYRLAAVDKSENVSEPSAVVTGRAYQARPAPPVWNIPQRIPTTNSTYVSLSWTHPEDQQLACLVARRAAGGAMWVSISGWLPPGKYIYEDIPPDITLEWHYRVRVRDGLGQTASQSPTVTLPALS